MSRKVTLTLVAQPTRYGHRGMPPLSLEIWEQCFAFEMENEGVDIPAIDAFLANGPLEEEDPPALSPDGRKGWAPEGDTRRRLVNDRKRSFEAYVRADYSLAAALARGLRSACEYAGFRHVAEPLAKIGAGRRTQMREFQAKSAAARRKYTEADRTRWRALAANYPHIQSKRRRAELIAEKLGLAPAAIESIRKAIE